MKAWLAQTEKRNQESQATWEKEHRYSILHFQTERSDQRLKEAMAKVSNHHTQFPKKRPGSLAAWQPQKQSKSR